MSLRKFLISSSNGQLQVTHKTRLLSGATIFLFLLDVHVQLTDFLADQIDTSGLLACHPFLETLSHHFFYLFLFCSVAKTLENMENIVYSQLIVCKTRRGSSSSWKNRFDEWAKIHVVLFEVNWFYSDLNFNLLNLIVSGVKAHQTGNPNPKCQANRAERWFVKRVRNMLNF